MYERKSFWNHYISYLSNFLLQLIENLYNYCELILLLLVTQFKVKFKRFGRKNWPELLDLPRNLSYREITWIYQYLFWFEKKHELFAKNVEEMHPFWGTT